MSTWKPIDAIAEDVKQGKVKAVELVNKSLSIIDEKQEYQAIIAKTEERANKRAEEIDNKVREGIDPGKLAGVPFIAKDNFLVFGADTTAASNILKGFDAPYQATAVEKLEAEGAICVAKANLDAFAHGSSTENSDFFVTKNPYDKIRVPGGSSGGSATAVALEMAPFALGTDTGGSIRQPASFCGVVGYKPTYGLVSRSGVVAMASSTDVIGPLTRTVADSASVLEVMAGKDELDGTTIDRSNESYTRLNTDLKELKIGVIKEYMDSKIDPKINNQVNAAIEKLKNEGVNVIEIALPSLEFSLAVYYIICPAEVSSNLSRYDGQRYGFSDLSTTSLEESYNKSRSTGFGNEAKRRIMIGTYVLSSGYYDAYYQKAQLVRTKLIKEYEEAFNKVDFLVGPVSPVLPFKIGEKTDDPLSMYLSDIMMAGANLAGLPAVSIPISMAEKLPIGFQIIAPRNKDKALLGVAKAFEDIIK